ncbi:glutamyl endopeptidase [Amycolatopsis cihanbeyliensis]|uniref:Serine protease n=1 Tax=Amycolatopsis cihanbeyliensis TaxID=1128664 RepID=A0A542CSA7_AMYCI|nr:glutamyl endopeptidase [Amycolatopsis cihanbeyliensis]
MFRYRSAVAVTAGLVTAFSIVVAPVASSAPGLVGLDPDTSISDEGRVGSAGFADAGKGASAAGFPGTGDLADATGVNTKPDPAPDPSGPGGDIHAGSIIGPDGRTRVNDTTTFPARATVYLTYTKPGGATSWCTGWMYAPNAVATAGHCVHGGGSSGDWNYGFTVYPGRNGGSSPYGGCTVDTKYSVLGWTRDRNTEYDYGGLKLNCTVGDTVGWYGMRWQGASYDGTLIFSRGYPQDKPQATQWFTSDEVRQSDIRQLRYRLDTVGGQSGSPVYMFGCEGYCGIAVHTTGYSDHNRGTRITEQAFDNYQSWKS